MPALHLFRRRTIFAGDDLQPTSFLTILARAVQLTLFLIPILGHMIREADYFISLSDPPDDGEGENGFRFRSYLSGGNAVYSDECLMEQRNDNENQGNDYTATLGAHYFPLFLFVYLIASIGHFLISGIVEYKIYKISNIGSPTEPELRNSQLVRILEKKWIWLSLFGNITALAFVLVSILYKGPYFQCRDIMTGAQDDREGGEGDDTNDQFSKYGLWWIALILLIASQLGEFSLSAIALINLLQQKVDHFVSEGQSHLIGTNDHNEHHHYHPSQHPHELLEEMWDTRCRNFCKCAAFSTCFLFGGRELMDDMVGDYGDISRALADYFEDGGALDLVPSDIATGFMMLQRVQRLRVLKAQQTVVEEMKSENRTTEGSQMRSDSVLDWSSHDGPKRTPSQEKEAYRQVALKLALTDSDGSDNHSTEMNAVKNNVISERMDSRTIPPLIDMSASPLQPLPHSNLLILPNTDDEESSSPYVKDHHDMALTLRMVSKPNRDDLHWYEAQRRKVLSQNDEIDRMVIAEGARFARHALSIYSWLLYVYMYPGTGLTKLIYNRFAECCKKKVPNDKAVHLPQNLSVDERSSLLCGDNSDNVLGDNTLHINKNALLAHSGLDESDLIFADFNNTYHKMPYCIVLDHKWKSVVLSIRGTLSLEDCVIDVLLEPDPLDDLGRDYGFDATGEYCHNGVLGCAKIIHDELEQHHILDKLLLGPDALYPHYSLRITGHSLGAGTATLLGYMMKRKFPSLRVISISPPGGFLTKRLATECKDFVTSFVLDSDLIPRLSISTMEQLRDEILELFGRIKVPKAEIAKSFIRNGVFCDMVEEDNLDFLSDNNERMLHSEESMSRDSTFASQLLKFKEIQRNRKIERGERREIKLFPPGQMVHLIKTEERTSCCHALANCATCCTTNAGYEYTPVWAENDDFNEILVSSTLWTDHFPNRVCVELERVAETFGIDTSIGSSIQDKKEAESVRRTGSHIVGIF